MQVLLVNGSLHEYGCTYTALSEIADTLEGEGIRTSRFWIGKKAIAGCMACSHCAREKRCAIDDTVNQFLDIASEYDGFVFGAPVHYAAVSGNMTSFMDRVFFTDLCGGRDTFFLKPAAAVVSARRAGTTAALDQLNKYFQHAQMPIVPSKYWNMVHGSQPEEVRADEEGMQVMRVLARNMAWLLKCKEAGKQSGVEIPKQEQRISTNFIR
ncbi:MAG: flavodoxin family protein [Eubacteriales bacterium]|nr:flavodoxin family protein [Eubacteriales bacterium]